MSDVLTLATSPRPAASPTSPAAASAKYAPRSPSGSLSGAAESASASPLARELAKRSLDAVVEEFRADPLPELETRDERVLAVRMPPVQDDTLQQQAKQQQQQQPQSAQQQLRVSSPRGRVHEPTVARAVPALGVDAAALAASPEAMSVARAVAQRRRSRDSPAAPAAALGAPAIGSDVRRSLEDIRVPLSLRVEPAPPPRNDSLTAASPQSQLQALSQPQQQPPPDAAAEVAAVKEEIARARARLTAPPLSPSEQRKYAFICRRLCPRSYMLFRCRLDAQSRLERDFRRKDFSPSALRAAGTPSPPASPTTTTAAAAAAQAAAATPRAPL
jgi:hypothetical protein